ncbi:MAG: SMP-30/gluconolactonase/LRE family protein [Planctomycetaceae bacterium]|nr:SMP-30/gluconolactonase/LRE family protein [Planctomycetaceae bacterium]
MSHESTQESRRRRIEISQLIRLTVICSTLALLAAPMPSSAADIVPEGAEVEELWNEGEFTEGVAVAPDATIYFSDIPEVNKGRILKFDPATGQTTVFCADSGKSNGLMFDREGRLIAACGANVGHQALCEFMPDGSSKAIVGKFVGKVFNSPNDIVILPNGRIYFTDPRYVGDEPIELDHMSVFLYVPSTKELSRASHGITKPNGIVSSPDGRTLYVSENNNGGDFGGQEQQSRRQLLACTILKDSTLGAPRVLVDFGDKGGIDGMTVDQKGHIYAAVREPSRPGIVVFDPEGKEVAYIKTDVLPSNCCFGRGDEASTLYITAGGGLYRIPLILPGFHPATAEIE